MKQTEYIYVDEDFLETMGITLVDGHNFSQYGKNFCVVNESLIRGKGIQNPVGTQIKLGENNFVIAGVIKDYYQHSFHETINPFVIYYNPEQISYVMIRMLPGNLRKSISEIRNIVREVAPDTPFELSFMDDQVRQQYSTEISFGRLVMLLTILAVVISSFGLLGLSLMIAQNRIKEIGIRKVNGAKIIQVLALLNSEFIKWVAIAFIVACPIIWYVMHKWLENFAYQIRLSWWIFALAGFSAFTITILTVSLQSWKTATRNPVEALRYE